MAEPEWSLQRLIDSGWRVWGKNYGGCVYVQNPQPPPRWLLVTPTYQNSRSITIWTHPSGDWLMEID